MLIRQRNLVKINLVMYSTTDFFFQFQNDLRHKVYTITTYYRYMVRVYCLSGVASSERGQRGASCPGAARNGASNGPENKKMLNIFMKLAFERKVKRSKSIVPGHEISSLQHCIAPVQVTLLKMYL